MAKLVSESLEESYCDFPKNYNIRNRNSKPQKQHKDLMQEEGSVSKQLIPLIQNVDSFRDNVDGLRQAFYDILEDPETLISDSKKEEYYLEAENLNYERLTKYIVNISLSGGGLSVADY